MAKTWFTTLPDNYFMRQSRRGGRKELLFTVFALGAAHFGIFSPLRNQYYSRGVSVPWQRTTVDGQAWTL